MTDKIILGKQPMTGKPVELPAGKKILLLGTSGAGKSFCAKLILKKWLKQHGKGAFVLDAMNEYYPHSDYYKLPSMQLPDDATGFNPFDLMDKNEIIETLEYLADVANIDIDFDMKNEQSLSDIRDNLDAVGKTLFDKMLSVYNDTAFNSEIKYSPGGLVVSMRKPTETQHRFYLALALLRLEKEIMNTAKNEPKLLLIEDAWILEYNPILRRVLNRLINHADKRNLTIVITNQLMLATPVNLEKINDIIMFRSDNAASVREALGIPESFAPYMNKLQRGMCYVYDKKTCEPARITATEEEWNHFNTTPWSYDEHEEKFGLA